MAKGGGVSDALRSVATVDDTDGGERVVPLGLALSLIALGPIAERLRDRVAARLENRGLPTCAATEASAGAPAVVLFDAPTPVVLHRVRDLSCDGVDRVLAVGSEPDALAGGAAWTVLEAGASDAFAYDERPEWIERVAARVERWREVDAMVRVEDARVGLVGESRGWRSAVSLAAEAGRFSDVPIIVTGETGTGKELIARLIHHVDARARKGELVLADCTTIVPTLSGSEFFGHERGAFTGATAARDGAFALADGGTLFLDEVGELPATLQAELLRVVQEGVYKRVGGNEWRTTSFRLVCATHRDLFAEAEAGRFRFDLLYRLAGTVVRLPSLRKRREDIIPLASHFLRQLSGPEGPDLDPSVHAYLRARDYPGNVRELRQLATRMAARHVGPGPITVGDIPPEERIDAVADPAPSGDAFRDWIRHAVDQEMTLKEIAARAADAAISVALAEEGGNLGRAAQRLGVTRRALQLRRANGKLPSGEQVDGVPNAT